MIAALVKEDLVERIMVLDESQIEEITEYEVIDAAVYGLAIGDLHTERGWTRNAGGEQMLLPLLNEEERNNYIVSAAKIIQLQEEQKTVPEVAAAEALSILKGDEKI